MRLYCRFVFFTDFSFTLQNLHWTQTCLNNFKTVNITCDVQEKCRLVATISTSDCLFWPRSQEKKSIWSLFNAQRLAETRTIFNFSFNFAHLPTLSQIFASSLHYQVSITASSPPLPKSIKRVIMKIIIDIKEILNTHLNKQTCNQFSFVIYFHQDKMCVRFFQL